MRAKNPLEQLPHAQYNYEIGSHVAVVLQRLREDNWQTVRRLYIGTAVGMAPVPEDDHHSRAYVRTVLSSAPRPDGTTYGESHPHQVDCQPKSFVDEQVGAFTLRFSIEPLSE